MFGFFKKLYDSYQYWSGTLSDFLYRQIYNDAGRAIDTLYHDWRHYDGGDFVKKICGGGIGGYLGYAGGYWIGSVIIGLPCLFFIPTPLSPLVSPIIYTIAGNTAGAITMRFSAQLGYAQGDEIYKWLAKKWQSPELQTQLALVQKDVLEKTKPMLLAAFNQQKKIEPTSEWNITGLFHRKPQENKNPISWGSVNLS